MDHLLYSVTCQVIQGEALGELYCIFYYLLKHEIKFNIFEAKNLKSPKISASMQQYFAVNVLEKSHRAVN